MKQIWPNYKTIFTFSLCECNTQLSHQLFSKFEKKQNKESAWLLKPLESSQTTPFVVLLRFKNVEKISKAVLHG